MMLKIAIKKFVKLLGVKGLLLKVGDIAVSATKSDKDDKIWAKVKKVLEAL